MGGDYLNIFLLVGGSLEVNRLLGRLVLTNTLIRTNQFSITYDQRNFKKIKTDHNNRYEINAEADQVGVPSLLAAEPDGRSE